MDTLTHSKGDGDKNEVSDSGQEKTKKFVFRDQRVEEEKCLGCHSRTEARFSCPTCVKMGATDFFFCSQECFKKNWTTHKAFHKAMSQFLSERNSPGLSYGYDSLARGVHGDRKDLWNLDRDLCHFQTFVFTGTLRPFPRTPKRLIPAHITKPDYYETGEPESEVRSKYSNNIVIHTAEDIEILKKSCHIARRALDLAHSMVTPGITPDAIDEAVHNFIISMNAYPSPYNYYQFPKSCCISVNECICHGIPDLRPLQDGDIVNVDITVYYQGMHGDLNETFLCGNVSDEGKKLVKAAYECMMLSIASCKPGYLYRDIGEVISHHAKKTGFSVVRTYCGHGIGRLFHTSPNVPHYRKNKAIGIMKPGHVFTIEPMINAGVHQDVTWPDDWTSVTADGKLSAQFEHTVVITKTGVEILTGRLPSSPALGIDVLSEAEFLNEDLPCSTCL